ncbi:MAG: UPF0175 family protein [Thermoprotei archaeon]
MTTTVEIEGYLEQRLELLVGLGLYATKSEAVRDAVRHMLEKTDLTAIVVDMYSTGKVSLGFCTQACELSAEEFLMVLQRRGVRPHLGEESMQELEKKTPLFNDDRRMLVEGYTFSVLFDNLGADVLTRLLPRLSVAEPQLEKMPFEPRRLLLSSLDSSDSSGTLLPVRGFEEASAGSGLSYGEAAALAAAKKNRLLLVADDFYVRSVAEKSGVESASGIALVLWCLGRDLITQEDALVSFEKMFSKGYYLPLSPAELSAHALASKVSQ